MTDGNGHLDRDAEQTPEDDASRGLGLSEPILLDPHRLKEDIRLVQRAVKWKWKTPEDKCDGLVDRMFEITEKRSVSVMTKKGEVESVDGPADVNAIAAARVIVMMVGQNQAEEHAAEGVGSPQINVNVGVQVIESDDWYGTKAAIAATGTNGHATAGNGASTAGALESGSVQGGSLRPAVGKNGTGTNGHAEGPRQPPGAEAGGD